MKLLLVSLFLFIGSAAAFPNLGQHKNGQLEDGGKVWVLLVAGSNGYGNYRHQSDVCHAYQIVHAHGIPDEQIVVMMFDDIANNPSNPTPGVIINEPNGPNVYTGVPKDYTGNDVTADVFLKVLQGQNPGVGSGKVINSGPNDHIFTYYSDHGAEGLVAFPVGSYLYSDDLNNAIKAIEGKFAKFVFYLEACESGSMFDNILPSDIHVYATTASNPTESSWATFCGTSVGSCLADEYSYNWMHDSDTHDINTETLDTQFQDTKAATIKSHVMEYGDLDIASSDFVGAYQGNSNFEPKKKNVYSGSYTKVNARDVPVHMLEVKLASTNEDKQNIQKQLDKLLKNRQFLSNSVNSIVEAAVAPDQVNEALTKQARAVDNMACYRKVVDHFHQNCFDITLNTFALGHLQVFANLCHMAQSADIVINAMNKVCTHPTIIGIE